MSKQVMEQELEAVAWAANEYIAAGNTFPFGFTVSTTQKYADQQPLYTKAQLLQAAQAAYTAGAADIKERAISFCRENFRSACDNHGLDEGISTLPITTDTQGELG